MSDDPCQGCLDDLRLLNAESLRAEVKLRLIRELLDSLRSEQRINPEAYAELWNLANEPGDRG